MIALCALSLAVCTPSLPWTPPVVDLPARAGVEPARRLPALRPGYAPPAELAFAPARGTELTRSFRIVQELGLVDSSTVVNEEEYDLDLKMELATETHVVVRDRLAELGPGRPERLRRTFETLDRRTRGRVGTGSYRPTLQESESRSELVGASVELRWNATRQGFVAALVDGDAPLELLAGLEEDMDLRAVLPGRPVEPGDSWELDPGALVGILAPGGDVGLALVRTDDGGRSPEPEPSLRQKLGELGGEATALYEGVRREEGRELAVVRLSFRVRSQKDLTELLGTALAHQPGERQGIEEVTLESAESTDELDLEGELLWDLAAGHFRSLALAGDYTTSIHSVSSVRFMGRTNRMEQRRTMTGSLEVAASVE